MLKDSSAMLADLEGMVSVRGTPTFDLVSSIEDIFENEIRPGLRDTQYAAAQDTFDVLSVIDSCHKPVKGEGGQDPQRSKWLSTLHAQSSSLHGG